MSHFIVFKIIRPFHHYERGCIIGYAIWISIGCHASYPMRWWQAAFPTHMQSVMCHLSFDEENKVWGILHSDRCEMKFPHSATIWSAFSVLISNQRLNFTSKRLYLVDAVALIYIKSNNFQGCIWCCGHLSQQFTFISWKTKVIGDLYKWHKTDQGKNRKSVDMCTIWGLYRGVRMNFSSSLVEQYLNNLYHPKLLTVTSDVLVFLFNPDKQFDAVWLGGCPTPLSFLFPSLNLAFLFLLKLSDAFALLSSWPEKSLCHIATHHFTY